MLLVPKEMAEQIVQWGSSHIDDAEVYGKDGKGRDGSPHITLQNGIMCDDAAELERLFGSLQSMEVELGPVSVFRNDEKDYDVVHIQVVGEQLHKANMAVSEVLEVNNPHPDYKPHITLAYVNKGAGKRFDGLKDFVGQKVKLGKIVIDGPNIEPKALDLQERVDHLAGGKADKMTEADFDQKQLEDGARHELEHTKNIELAREIAMDHLAEDPNYYEHLKAVEASKKRCKHTKGGYWCGRCEPLKESLDYSSSKTAYLIEDFEDYLLTTGRTLASLRPGEMESIMASLVRDLKE